MAAWLLGAPTRQEEPPGREFEKHGKPHEHLKRTQTDISTTSSYGCNPLNKRDLTKRHVRDELKQRCEKGLSRSSKESPSTAPAFRNLKELAPKWFLARNSTKKADYAAVFLLTCI